MARLTASAFTCSHKLESSLMKEILVATKAVVAAGLSNEDIAGRLVLSPATVKTHVNRAMMKLGARDRAHLVVFAYEAGLVRPGWAN